MTLVMIWKERGAERVWVVSDSRLTEKTERGHFRLTDRAAKILEAPVILHSPYPPYAPLWSTSLGFTYAGSTLIALEAYSAVIPLWSRLQARTNRPPTLSEFAEHLAKFLRGYALELAAASGPDAAACECALLGYGQKWGTFAGWRVRTRAETTGLSVEIERLRLTDRHLEFLGSGKEEALIRLKCMPRNDRRWRREPIAMMRAFLGEEPAEAVGGAVQIGMARPDGFQIYSDGQPMIYTTEGVTFPHGVMRYRGFDFADVGTVGDAGITLPGLGQQ